MENVIKEESAREALDLVTSSRADVADRLVTPWWYHPILGVLSGVLIAAPATRSPSGVFIALSFFFVGCGALMLAYRRMTGVWVSGFNAGRASLWAGALGAICGLGYLASYILAFAFGWWPVSLGLAVLAVPATVLLGRRFDTALRA